MTSTVPEASRSAQSPSLKVFLIRGMVGFTVVSLAGFLPWVWFGRWFRNHGGELAMYLTCAAVFIGSSGLLMHRLIVGSNPIRRFYRTFSPAFALYSVLWIAAWMGMPGHLGSVLGLLLGTAGMTWILVRAFPSSRAFLPVWLGLFVLNSLGYFVGGFLESWIAQPGALEWTPWTWTKGAQMRLAMASWGLAYGLGLGAGLGFAFYRCQQTEAPVPEPTPGFSNERSS